MADLIGQIIDQPIELAQQLIKEFGTLENVISASDERLQKSLSGQPKIAPLISSARAVHSLVSRSTKIGTPVSRADKRLHQYLIDSYRGLQNERLMVIFLDASSLFIRLEFLSEGNQQEVKMNPLQIVARSFDLSARRLIMAHNHPSNIAYPSQLDIDTTQALSKLCSSIGVEVEDHFIVTEQDTFSMREADLL